MLNIPSWILALVMGMLPAGFKPFAADVEADIAAGKVTDPIPQLNDAIDAFTSAVPKYAKIGTDAKKLLNDSITIIVPDVENIIADVKAIG
jgi:hypothetical protein